jgi:hypothetical protein
MALAPGIHVVPDGDHWAIKIAYDFDTKAKAEASARLVSGVLNGELVVHEADGTIGRKDSHGNDPPEIPG